MANETSVDNKIDGLLELAFERGNLTWKDEGVIGSIIFELTHRVAEISTEQRVKMERLLEHPNGRVVQSASNFFRFRNLLESLPALEQARFRLLSKDPNADRWEETKAIEAAIEHLKHLVSLDARSVVRTAPEKPAIAPGNAYTRNMLAQPGSKKLTIPKSGPKAGK